MEKTPCNIIFLPHLFVMASFQSRFRELTVFLLIADFMTSEDKLKVLCGLAALYTFRNKTVHAAKKQPPGFKFDVALHLLVRHCARGSPLTHLLATG